MEKISLDCGFGIALVPTYFCLEHERQIPVLIRLCSSVCAHPSVLIRLQYGGGGNLLIVRATGDLRLIMDEARFQQPDPRACRERCQ